ncbi:MAG: hypothetical protein DRO40_06675 [Thermoprotei archaeon]|nr:MAG: hypothetical protein DRO40_06675 [Thermoprotei archaeon]
MKVDKYDFEIITYIAKNHNVVLAELIRHFSNKWKITDKAIYKRIKKLERYGYIELKRISRQIIKVDFTVEFLALIELLHKMIHYDKIYWGRKVEEFIKKVI